VRESLLAALAAAKANHAAAGATVATLEAAIAACDSADDPLLDLGSVEAQGVSPHTARSWIRSGRLTAHQAERGRFVFRRSALLRALEASPVQRRERQSEPSDLDAWEREADATLRLVGGAR
jgi:hypothetical protein